MKIKLISVCIIGMSFIFSNLANAVGPTDVDRQQLKTQIEIRDIQLERYKLERQMMLDLNDIKNHLHRTKPERDELERKFPMLDKESLGYDALKESRNAD